MNEGRILVASKGGDFLIRLVGDLRVTICTSLSCYLDFIFKQKTANSVCVDMLAAEGIDSTTLGLLVKLGLYSQKKFGVTPIAFCDNPDLERMLRMMSIDEVFDIQHSPAPLSLTMQELDCSDCNIDEAKKYVIEAHKLLIELNPDKEKEFIDLIKALEAES